MSFKVSKAMAVIILFLLITNCGDSRVQPNKSEIQGQAKGLEEGAAGAEESAGMYSLKITLDGLVAFVPMEDGGSPVVWALLPRLDERSPAQRRQVRGTKRILPSHAAFLEISAKNFVKGNDCWDDAERGSGDAPIFLALGSADVTKPQVDKVSGYEVIFDPRDKDEETVDFAEAPAKIEKPEFIPSLGEAPLQAKDAARVKPVYYGNNAGLIEPSELVSRIKFKKGVLRPEDPEPGPYVYGFYQGDLELAGGKIEAIAEKVSVNLTYKPRPLDLTLNPFKGGSQKNFVLCPSPGESSIEVRLVNLPVGKILGIQGKGHNVPGSRDEHFIAYHGLSSKALNTTNHAFVFPVKVRKSPGSGGDPYCSTSRMLP